MTSRALAAPRSRRKRPPLSSPAAGKRLIGQATRDTNPELTLRRELHARGLRYRVHLRPLHGFRREADIVFSRKKIAVFVDGCFWHGCAAHPRSSRANANWWASKIAENRARDSDTNERLTAEGWVVVRVWEHDDAVDAARRIHQLVMRTR